MRKLVRSIKIKFLSQVNFNEAEKLLKDVYLDLNYNYIVKSG